MKIIKITLILLFLSLIRAEAQTSVDYVVSKYNIQVGDSAKIKPIILNARPNSKTHLTINSLGEETFKKNTQPFYFTCNLSGHYTMTITLKLIENDKVYFEDVQYLEFHTYKILGDIYTLNDTITTFVGFEYPIRINIQGFSVNDIFINAQGVTIRKVGEDFQYNLINAQVGFGQITILGRRNDGTKFIINKFPIKTVSAPVPTVVATIQSKDSTIELKSILNDQFMFKCTGGVDSFTVSFEKSGKKISKKFIGSRIDTLTYLELMSLPPKTWIYFEDIYHWINFPGGKNKKSNIAITIP